jgi:NADH:ubiquinone reductase (H+-translocating)
MARRALAESTEPLVILGAGYAGLTLAQEVDRRSRGGIPIVLVDRHPVHVLRTELYEVGDLAGARGDVRRWIVPLAQVFDRTSVTLHEGSVDRIDLERSSAVVDGHDLPYRALAICLGNVASYYGVPGAPENTSSVYRLTAALRTADSVREIERGSMQRPGEERARIVVVGGGSTGTELAAEIATTDWAKVVGGRVRPPDVYLLTGSLPFLAGFPPRVIEIARRTLRGAGVTVVHGHNVVRVEPQRLHLADGTVLAFDLAVWCAGLEAPGVVRDLPVRHGKGGRVAVEPTLEVSDHPGVFAVGDVAELKDPDTGVLVPGTAQAALSEARAAATNVVARLARRPLRAYRYRERGLLVSLGARRGAGTVGPLTLWGNPARFLKRVVEREYSFSARRGEPSRLL